MQVIGYRRVSSDQQGASGLGLEAQTVAVEDWAQRHGHTIVMWKEDVQTGGRKDREAFQDALLALQNGEAEALVIAKVDRLTRSLLHFAEVVETANKQGWKLVALDIGMDMTTPSGKAMAGMLAVFAEYERSMASVRTREAVERRRERLGGTLPGTRPAVPTTLRTRLKAMREHMSLQQIADTLEAERVPTAQGGKWWPGTVKWVLEH